MLCGGMGLGDPDDQGTLGGFDDVVGDGFEFIDLQLVGKHAHWNIVGPNFRELHLNLDEVVAIARECAERSPPASRLPADVTNIMTHGI